MARITSFVAAAAIALTSSAAFAGGPATEYETEDKPVVVVAEGCSSSVSLCPAGAGAAALGGLGGGAALGAAVGVAALAAALGNNSSGSH